jgi:hypothetical protein
MLAQKIALKRTSLRPWRWRIGLRLEGGRRQWARRSDAVFWRPPLRGARYAARRRAVSRLAFNLLPKITIATQIQRLLKWL